MVGKRLDVSDAAALEAALEAAEPGALAHVTTGEGEDFVLQRVEGGWYLPGDVVVTSGDVADGRPTAVHLWARPEYRGEDPFDDRDWAESHWNSGTAVVVDPSDWPQAPLDQEDDQ